MTAKRRIAILGGGVGALSAAFALSELDPTGKRYEITLYQLGWRLGGKTANGRNAEFGQRIEEHGLHIWAGFYENAFTILRAALKALDRPPGTPQATIDQAFLRQSQIFMTERFENAWQPWPAWFEPDADVDLYPGRDSIFAAPDAVMPSTAILLRRAFAAIEYNYIYYKDHWAGDPTQAGRDALDALPPAIRLQLDAVAGGLSAPNLLLLVAKLLLDRLAANPLNEEIRLATLIVFDLLLKEVQAQLARPGLETGFRRFLLMLDLMLRVTIGIIQNEALRHGLHVIDQFEFREFLAQAGPMNPIEDSVLIGGLYDYAFAYAAGVDPSMSACGAVQGLLRMFLTYKGGFFYKATAGMGDTICTPIYELLRSRGVSFRFFQEVKQLNPDADGFAIETIDLIEQAELAPGVVEYQPLVEVNGLQCWPSEPHWDQLQDGAKLQAEGIDFEDVLASAWHGTPRTLTRGQDFDEVVLGISVGALADICAPLAVAKPAWQDMVTNLATARTQAFQMWMTEPVVAMGGAYVQPVIPPPLPKQPARPPEKLGPIVTGFEKPFDTYADMSHLIDSEAWPADGPKSVAYFCAVLPDDAPGEQGAADALVKAHALDWIDTQLPTLWPGMFANGAFDWSKVWCKNAAEGPARFDQQFWQANINPSERYVLARPGTLQHRMAPGESGFGNLFLCGDWTLVPDINAGCVEVAAMSGLMAASALTGYEIPIVAGDTLYTKPPFINYAGWISLPPAPAVAHKAEFHSWVFKGDPAAMQDFVDRSLNKAAGRRRFKIATPFVFLNRLQANDLSSGDPAFGCEGVMAETDVGFWLLLVRYDFGPDIPTGYGWFPAYLFVDEAYAVACGREIWGFAKYASTISAADDAVLGPFTVSAQAITRFKPGAPSGLETLIAATPDPAVERHGFIGSLIDGVKRLVDHLEDDAAEVLVDLADKSHLLGANGILPHVYFLKQFRSADDATEACYRQILKGALTLDHQYALNFLHGGWTFEFSETDSLPFIRDLGLGTPKNGKLLLDTPIGFHATVDFTVAPARPIG